HLSFTHGHPHQFSINTSSQCDRLETHYRTEARQVNGLISRLCGCCNHRYRCGSRRTCGLSAVVKREIRDYGDKNSENQRNPKRPAEVGSHEPGPPQWNPRSILSVENSIESKRPQPASAGSSNVGDALDRPKTRKDTETKKGFLCVSVSLCLCG